MSAELPRVLTESLLESRRFGLRLVRGVLSTEHAADTVLNDINILRPDVAIFRCAAGDTSQIAALGGVGLYPLHADTLVYYAARLRDDAPLPPPTPAHDIRRASPSDADAVAGIVRGGFHGYRNHYHANPRLLPAAILEGYVEWALDYATVSSESRQTWIYSVNGIARSFATCRLNENGEDIEVVLNATAPDAAGHGFYSRLLEYLMAHFGRTGRRRVLISTQIWNYVVQRVWARAGLVIESAYDTYHVNVPHGYWETAS